MLCLKSVVSVRRADKMKEIIDTLSRLTNNLRAVTEEWYIFSGAALILSGFEIGRTHDIDIMTSVEGTEQFRRALGHCLVKPEPKNNDLFRSNLLLFRPEGLEIEVAGDLHIKKGEEWHKVEIMHFDVLQVAGLDIRIPTIDEQCRLLELFGRPKDLRRLEYVKQTLKDI